MKSVEALKNIRNKLDRYSPYPLYYEFGMSDNEKVVYDRLIKKSSNYLEFGMGGSTIRAILKSKANIFTVEPDSAWITYMRQYAVLRFFEDKRLFIFHVDIGPTGLWGYPESDEDKEKFPAFSSHVFKAIDASVIDLVLIDARFRVACALKLIMESNGNSDPKILIHDFWNREQYYHVVLKYLDTLLKVDTLGLFAIKKDVNLESVAKDYELYKTQPW